MMCLRTITYRSKTQDLDSTFIFLHTGYERYEFYDTRCPDAAASGRWKRTNYTVHIQGEGEDENKSKVKHSVSVT